MDDKPGNLAADRVLRVLSAFRESSEELGVTEIGTLTRLDKSVVHRILTTLAYHQFVQQDPRTRRYRVGLRAWEVGQRYASRRRLEEVAVPLIRDLVEECWGTGYVGLLDGLDIVYVALVPSPGPLRVHVDVGSRTEAHATALGKAMLAFLPQAELDELLLDGNPLRKRTPETIDSVAALKRELQAVRRKGFAVNSGEHTDGVAAVGCAIRNEEGYPIAGVSVAFPQLEQFAGLMQTLPERLSFVAMEAARRLGISEHTTARPAGR